MATKAAANQLAQHIQRMKLTACRRVLAKGRAMQSSGQWESVGGYDVFACWKWSLSSKDRLPESYELDVSYLDTKSLPNVQPSSLVGSVLLVHGTPGTHNDYKYIIPVLADKKIRAVVPNLPGNTETKQPAIYRNSNDERAEFLKDFVNELGLNKVDVMVGHSGGLYPLLKLASDDEYYSADGTPIFRNMLLVNPGGTQQLHKVVQPYWIPRLISRLQHTRLRPLIGWSQYIAWNYILGLRIPSGEIAMACTDCMANVGLYEVPKYAKRLASDPKTPRVLMLYAEDDPICEKERGEETAEGLGAKIFKVSSKEDLQGALDHVREWVTAKDGARHAAIAFAKGMGGHYLQKHQAGFVASCLEMMVAKSK